jgi:hypothetical protein
MIKRIAVVLMALGICGPSGFFYPLPSSAQTVAFESMPRGDFEALVRKCPEGNALRCARLQEYFRDFGCPEARLATQDVKGSPEPNVIATLPGLSDSTILVGAHFDYSPRGSPLYNPGIKDLPSKGMGLIDNWSGALLLPVIYKSLSTRPREHTFVFIGFAAEEKGLKGSKSYAALMSPEDVARAKAMVNLDCLGMSTTAVWVERADPTLWEYMKRASAVTGLPLRGMNLTSAFHFDSESFRKTKIPVIVIHSTTQETILVPHSFLDNFLLMNLKEYYDSYLLITAFLAYLDLKLK